MTTKSNWILNPTRKQYNICLIVYGIGLILLILSMTNIFEDTFTVRNFEIRLNVLTMLLIAASTGSILRITRNYKRNNSNGSQNKKQEADPI